MSKDSKDSKDPVIHALKRFLYEDLGRRGDITSAAVLGNTQIDAAIVANEPCVLAGSAEAAMLFSLVNVVPSPLAVDGTAVKRGTRVLAAHGTGKAILSCERTALNLLGRMSGIATLTHELVQRCARLNSRVKIAATRKTTPGLRYFEKKAVELGGGIPHRAGLYDALLIKDNHVAIVGSVAETVRRARAKYHTQRLEVEVSSLLEGVEAVKSGADVVMLDNMPPHAVKKTYQMLKRLNPELEVEVSGSITPKNITNYARWADIISLGYITHSVRSIDFALEIFASQKF